MLTRLESPHSKSHRPISQHFDPMLHYRKKADTVDQHYRTTKINQSTPRTSLTPLHLSEMYIMPSTPTTLNSTAKCQTLIS